MLLRRSLYQIKDFIPLFILITIIIFLTMCKQWYEGFNWYFLMTDFMGFFFIIFGSFKIIRLSSFATAYAEYDIIAQNFFPYGYLYPFIELFLGICYLFRWQLNIVNWITLIVMVISSVGVARALIKQQSLVCACLGTVFKIPMTYVTLAEDILMAIMALLMILQPETLMVVS